MGELHAWAFGCALVSGFITFIVQSGDTGDALIAGAIAWVLTYILGPVIVAIIGE